MKNIFKVTKRNNTEQGQVLLFVIVTMTIALALGVGLSLQTISSISNISSADSSKKSLAAAEGGAERALILDNDSLQSLVDDSAANCADQLEGTPGTNGYCDVEFYNTGDNVLTRASIKVEDYPGTGVNELNFTLNAGDVREIFLDGLRVDTEVCWNGDSDMYYMVYNEDGESIKNIVCAGGTCDPAWATSGAVTSVVSNYGYTTCTTIAASDMPSTPDPQGLRLRSLGGFPSDMYIRFDGNLPTQGYKITAIGGVEGADEVNRVVSVIKSFEYLPGYFDFSFYSEQNLGL